MKPLWIMIAGPYRGGAENEQARQKNLDFMNRAAYEVFKKGHIPIVGVNNALPLVKIAGDSSYDEIMMPICIPLTERCDAILRIGGKSEGADQEVEKFVQRRLPVYRNLDEVPVRSV